MDLLIIVSTPKSGIIAQALIEAGLRAGISCGVFFTNDGVCTLADNEFAATLSAVPGVIACGDSWQQHMGDLACPVTLGSQTNNSTMVGDAARVVSL